MLGDDEQSSHALRTVQFSEELLRLGELAHEPLLGSEDVIRVAEKLGDIERRLERIEARLEGNVTPTPDAAPRAGRPRTRQPPAAYLTEEKP